MRGIVISDLHKLVQSDSEVIEACCYQLEKDLNLREGSLARPSRLEDMIQLLMPPIESHLASSGMDQLAEMMYRVDIAQSVFEDAIGKEDFELLSDIVLNRIFQKIFLRFSLRSASAQRRR